MKRILIIVAALAATAAAAADDAVIKALQRDYQNQGAGAFSAETGKKMWTQQFASGGEARSCAKCHTDDLRKVGKQVNTGKPIDPMAPSVNSERLIRQSKVEKWFNRNCKWTMGRVCTAQEKGDFLAYIAGQ